MSTLSFAIDGVRISANGFETDIDRKCSIGDPHVDQIALCRAWLQSHVRATKTIRPRTLSYGLKHRVESWSRRFTGTADYLYVSNGAFIVAAALEGFALERVHWTSPNALFAFTCHGVAADGAIARSALRPALKLVDALSAPTVPREWGSPPVREDVLRALRARMAAAEKRTTRHAG